MGMQFSPMYQPVSTKTIKADGDLNVNPYDLLATDVKCDTVEADEFVGGVGNFTSGLFSNGVQGLLFVPASIDLTSGTVYATCPAISSSTTSANWNITIPDYTVSSNLPIEHSIGVYTRTEDISNEELAHVNTRTLTFKHLANATTTISYKETSSTEWITLGTLTYNTTATVTLKTDTEYNFKQSRSGTKLDYSVPEEATVYITYPYP